MVKHLIFILTLTFSFGVQSQISFYKRYNGNGYDFGKGIVQLPDSSYMVCGSSTSFLNGAPQAYLMKLDSLGDLEYSRHYGGLETESAQRIFYTPNEGYYVAGHTNSTPTGDFDFYFFHTDVNGDLLWEKSFGTSSWDILNDAIKLPDSSYILTGETFNPIDGEKDGYIVRLDKHGDTLWTKSSGHLGEDLYYDIENFYDTSFVVCGKAWNADSSMFKSYIGCYELDGTLLWENQYGPDGNYEVKSIAKHDGYIIGVGNRISPIDNLADDYAVKVTDQGVLNFTFSYHALGYRSYDFITRYGGPNDFYMAFSNDDALTTGPGKDLYVGDFNELVGFEGTGVDVDGSHDDLIGEIIPTSDSAAVFVGTNENVDGSFEIPNVFVVKIGKDQLYPNTLTKPLPVSILDIEEGSIVGYDVQLYPNPVENQLNISISNLKTTGTFKLVDLTGKVVSTYILDSEYTNMNVSFLEKGIYILMLEQSNGQISTLGKITKN